MPSNEFTNLAATKGIMNHAMPPVRTLITSAAMPALNQPLAKKYSPPKRNVQSPETVLVVAIDMACCVAPHWGQTAA